MSSRISYLDPLIQRLELDRVASYLTRSGWHETDHPNDRIVLFQRTIYPDDPPFNIFLPKKSTFADLPERLADAVNMLCSIENLDPQLVVQRMSVRGDILAMRLKAAPSLGNAPKLWEGLKEMVGFSAANEHKPKPWYTYEPKFYKDHTNRSRPGHTFDGSYGITIELPVPDQLVIPGFTEKPFERRVAERINHGLIVATEAASQRDYGIIVQNYTSGLNGNMCQSLQDLSAVASEHVVKFEFAWSPDIPANEELQKAGEIIIEPPVRTYVDQALQELKNIKRPEEDYLVYGKVTDLHSKEDPQDTLMAEPRWVVVEWKTGRRSRNIRVYLYPRNYREACDAHKEGRPVKALGKVEKKNSHLVMLEPKEFAVGS